MIDTHIRNSTENQSPIGIFDSGLGGLSIARAVRDILPAEDLMYFADTDFSPYGSKSRDQIVERSAYITHFLINRGCKLIVVACNTATVNAISILRSEYSVPIVGVEPGVKPAALKSVSGVVGVLATEQTLKSASYQRLKSRYSGTVKIQERACPDFVFLVENLAHENIEARVATERHMRPLLDAGCDQIILGCTHFSFLKQPIKKAIGANAGVVDTAEAVGFEVRRKLHQFGLCKDHDTEGGIEFWTSSDGTHACGPISRLWGQRVDTVFQAGA